MEQSLSDVVETCLSPPRRRLSTLFERRESIVLVSKNIQPNSKKNVTDIKEKHTHDLQRYYDKLVAEKEQWKKEVQSRRDKYHDIRLEFKTAAKAPSRSRISYSSLLNEDIEFLKGKIHIKNLVDSQMKLHESIKETHALFNRVTKFEDVILSYCEDKVEKFIGHIFNNSTKKILKL